MNKKGKTVLTIVLCGAIAASSVGVNTYAKKNIDLPEKQVKETKLDIQEKKEKSEFASDETLYVFTDASGSVRKIVVSDEMREKLGNKVDPMDENLIGMEKYLPVEMKVTYMLDGQPISAEELVGKSGHLAMHIEYTNMRKKTVILSGEKEEFYVPYIMLTGMILDNNVFSNIQISNGKILDDGERTMAAGFALPGMKEDLKISDERLDIPDSVDLEADVQNFEMMETMTIATNEVFNQMDTSNLDSIEGLQESMNQMQDAMNQLMGGSKQLTEGLHMLNDKTGELSEGIGKLTAGSLELKNGAYDLKSGAGALSSGVSELSTGLAGLASNNGAVTGGAEQVFASLLSMGQQQLEAAGLPVGTLSIGNYADVLNGVIASLDENAVYDQALQMVTEKVEANRPLIEEGVKAAVLEQVRIEVTAVVRQNIAEKVTAGFREEILQKITEAVIGSAMGEEAYQNAIEAGEVTPEQQAVVAGMLDEQMAGLQDAIQGTVDTQMESGEIQSLIEQNTAEQMESENVQSTIAENIEIQIQMKISEAMASDEVQAKLTAASEGAKAVIGLKSALDSYNSFYLGLIAYTDGVSTAASGASKLNSGAAALDSGTAQLYEGAAALSDGVGQLGGAAPAMTDGVRQLVNGSETLTDGLTLFNEQAVQKLIDAVDGDVKGLLDRLKGMVEVSKKIDQPVKIIYRTDKIE